MNEHHSDRIWKVCLRGSFRLTDPAGSPVQFQNVKVEALLSILVTYREYGISRDDLAAILWPNKSEELQKASLRQALALCRRVIGVNSVDASRTHCRLSSQFQVHEVSGTGEFMPGHEGSFFDDHRNDPAEDASEEMATRNVLSAWRQVLEWNAFRDPGMFFNMLQMAPHHAEGIVFTDLERLLNIASAKHGRSAWSEYWWGTVMTDLNECRKRLKVALDLSIEQQDLGLSSMICLELGRACARTGRVRAAITIADYADELAATSRTNATAVNALRLRGTLAFNWGSPARGKELLTAAIGRASTTMEQHQLTASLAVFQAGYGFTNESQDNIARVRTYAESLGHMKMDSLTKLANYVLIARSTNGGRNYEALRDQMASDPISIPGQLESYREELLGSLCGGPGSQTQRKAHLERANFARQKSHDVATNWARILRGEALTEMTLVHL